MPYQPRDHSTLANDESCHCINGQLKRIQLMTTGQLLIQWWCYDSHGLNSWNKRKQVIPRKVRKIGSDCSVMVQIVQKMLNSTKTETIAFPGEVYLKIMPPDWCPKMLQLQERRKLHTKFRGLSSQVTIFSFFAYLIFSRFSWIYAAYLASWICHTLTGTFYQINVCLL